MRNFFWIAHSTDGRKEQLDSKKIKNCFESLCFGLEKKIINLVSEMDFISFVRLSQIPVLFSTIIIVIV